MKAPPFVAPAALLRAGARADGEDSIYASPAMHKEIGVKVLTRRRSRAISMAYKFVIISSLVLVSSADRAARPRVVISSDYPPLDVIPGGAGRGPPGKRSDPDDVRSMIRFLPYASEFRIEALIAASGTVAGVADKRNLPDTLEVYDRVEGNLRAHDRR